MKTILILILLLTTLNISPVTARSNSPKDPDGPTKSEMKIPVALLAPVTPTEATFEDTSDVNAAIISVTSLAPVTPKFAPFEEITDPGSSPVNQNSKSTEKGKPVHPDFPLPCDAKYGCSL